MINRLEQAIQLLVELTEDLKNCRDLTHPEKEIMSTKIWYAYSLLEDIRNEYYTNNANSTSTDSLVVTT